MDRIPPLGWATIAGVILMTLAINGWLIALLRNRRPPPPPRIIHPRLKPQQLETILRDPFHDETQQLDELSKRIQQLSAPHGNDRPVDKPGHHP